MTFGGVGSFRGSFRAELWFNQDVLKIKFSCSIAVSVVIILEVNISSYCLKKCFVSV